MSLPRRRLGADGPEISVLGFGTWAVGGEWAFGWGPQDPVVLTTFWIERATLLAVQFARPAESLFPASNSPLSREVSGTASRVARVILLLGLVRRLAALWLEPLGIPGIGRA